MQRGMVEVDLAVTPDEWNPCLSQKRSSFGRGALIADQTSAALQGLQLLRRRYRQICEAENLKGRNLLSLHVQSRPTLAEIQAHPSVRRLYLLAHNACFLKQAFDLDKYRRQLTLLARAVG
jgi:hypothetical protein